MSSKPSASEYNNDNKKRASYLLIALVITVVSIVATFITVSATNQKNAFRAGDIDAAANSCAEEIDDEYGDELFHSSFDAGSSSFNARRKTYTIWYRVSTRSTDKHGISSVKDMMVKCEVKEFLGYVSRMENYDL